MATQTQFDVFKYVYDEESARFSELVIRAKVYLSIATFFLGVLLFKFELTSSITRASTTSLFFLILSACSFFVALLMTVLSLRILPYEGICNPEQVINGFGREPPSDSEFLDDRIADLAVATQCNSEQNDKRAKCLQWASIIFLIGFGSSLIFLFVMIAGAVKQRGA